MNVEILQKTQPLVMRSVMLTLDAQNTFNFTNLQPVTNASTEIGEFPSKKGFLIGFADDFSIVKIAVNVISKGRDSLGKVRQISENSEVPTRKDFFGLCV